MYKVQASSAKAQRALLGCSMARVLCIAGKKLSLDSRSLEKKNLQWSLAPLSGAGGEVMLTAAVGDALYSSC